jgi:hypothetical protein
MGLVPAQRAVNAQTRRDAEHAAERTGRTGNRSRRRTTTTKKKKRKRGMLTSGQKAVSRA